MAKHVAVLMGGWSAEREVSLRSGAACARAAEQRGYRVSRVDVKRDIAGVLAELKPDVVLNVLHGRPGEDGTLQGILEVMGDPVYAFGRARLRDRDAEGRRQGYFPRARAFRFRRACWSRDSTPRRSTCCRAPTCSSRSPKAPASAYSSCVRSRNTRRRSFSATIGRSARWSCAKSTSRGGNLTCAVIGRSGARRHRDRPDGKVLRL